MESQKSDNSRNNAGKWGKVCGCERNNKVKQRTNKHRRRK